MADKHPPLTVKQRERYAAYLEEHGADIVARLVRSGQFVPDAPKWELAMTRSDEILRPAEPGPASTQPADVVKSSPPVPQPLHSVKAGLAGFQRTDEYQRSLIALQALRESLVRFTKSKWQEIQSARRKFGLADDRQYRVEVSAVGLKRLGVEAFEFDQQGHVPPAVGVTVVIHGLAFPARIDSNGDLRDSGTIREMYVADHLLLLNAAAVLLLLDLVVADERAQRVHRPSAPQGPAVGRKTPIVLPIVDRLIPRLSRDSEPVRTLPTGAARHSSDRPSQVDPFRRRLPEGQKPSFEKVVEADQFGINLQGPGSPVVNYTFVRAHIRGIGEVLPDYRYRQDYRAARTLESILALVGLE